MMLVGARTNHLVMNGRPHKLLLLHFFLQAKMGERGGLVGKKVNKNRFSKRKKIKIYVTYHVVLLARIKSPL